MRDPPWEQQAPPVGKSSGSCTAIRKPPRFTPPWKPKFSDLSIWKWNKMSGYQMNWFGVTFGDSWSNIELTLSIPFQFFFQKSIHFKKKFPKLYWIESTTNKFIAKSIPFDNFPIIYRFSTFYLLNTIINRFSMIKNEIDFFIDSMVP